MQVNRRFRPRRRHSGGRLFTTSSSRLRIAITCCEIVNEWRHHGTGRFRLDLSNGVRIAAVTTVADESRTMLSSGRPATRTIDWTVTRVTHERRA
jgi:hypothetical protein